MKKNRGIIPGVLRFTRSLVGKQGRSDMRNSDLGSYRFKKAQRQEHQRTTRSLQRLAHRLGKRYHLFKVKNVQDYKRKLGRISTFQWLKTGTLAALLLIFFVANGPALIREQLAASDFFKIRSLIINSWSAEATKRLTELAPISLHQSSLVGLDVKQIKTQIESDPWVKEANVKKDWPDTLVIEVVKRNKLALVNQGSPEKPQLYYIDGDGTPFLAVNGAIDIDYPVITGLERLETPESREQALKQINIFLATVGQNNPILPAQSVSEIHINGKSELVLYLVDHPFPIFLGKDKMEDKYKNLVRILGMFYRAKDTEKRLSRVEYIQMDYMNDKVLVANSESG